MTLRLGLFALTFACAMSASATVIDINYSGHITQTTGDGLGHTVGELVSGTFTIDTAKADGVMSSSPNNQTLYASSASGLLQSNYATSKMGAYNDFVSIYNSTEDQLSLTKVLFDQSSKIELLGVGFFFSGLDWIQDSLLSNINIALSDSNSLTHSDGLFGRFDILNNFSLTDSARFSFDSLSIKSSSVPEPSPLALLALGLAGIMLRRKIK